MLEELDEVFCDNEAILVAVEVKEGLPDVAVVLCQRPGQIPFELSQSLLENNVFLVYLEFGVHQDWTRL